MVMMVMIIVGTMSLMMTIVVVMMRSDDDGDIENDDDDERDDDDSEDDLSSERSSATLNEPVSIKHLFNNYSMEECRNMMHSAMNATCYGLYDKHNQEAWRVCSCWHIALQKVALQTRLAHLQQSCSAILLQCKVGT